ALAKGTAYVYGLPFGLWLTFSGIKRLGWKLWRPYAAMTAIGLALNISMFWRNFQVYGSIFGKADGEGNKAMNLLLLISNIVRNLALHLSTPVRSINLITIGVVQQFHKLIGVDVNEPLTTAPPGQKFDMHSLINHEDLAGNALHLLLFFASVGGFFSCANRCGVGSNIFWQPMWWRSPWALCFLLSDYLVAVALSFASARVRFSICLCGCRLDLFALAQTG
ncbi:MAG: hypothetical protein HC925_05460, partial [Coleofasciculaceae cyanobacterium SM2_3_26]|nr:hypothetical protein [Coleofasciculaceae cyanobacterium SM2_3_26]